MKVVGLYRRRQWISRYWCSTVTFFTWVEAIRHHSVCIPILFQLSPTNILQPDYLFRAFALDPKHPMINLSLALAYIQHAIKRQSDNRQHLLAQGFAFLFEYYRIRSNSDTTAEKQEAEFNMGRAYQLLGLSHLAVPFYERCLALDSRKDDLSNGDVGRDSVSREAAFALQGIWAAGGLRRSALRVTKRYLVI